MPPANYSYTFLDGADRFTPKDLIELARPGAGVANAPGTLVFVPVSKYSFADKKNAKSLVVASLESRGQLEIPLPDGGEAFWLGPTTLGHVASDAESKTASLYAINVRVETEPSASFPSSQQQLSTPAPPTHLGTFPTTSVSNFVYSPQAGKLVFSAEVYEDGDITAVRAHDDEWEARGYSAFVYEHGFERHWDTWAGPKKLSLFSVPLTRDESESGWAFGDAFANVLNGTGHHVPVEPFGGTDDFSVSDTHIVYTTKDPELPEATHTKQNIYLIPLDGSAPPRELTSGQQGATHGPVFDAAGKRVAWLELDKDGHESDRAKIVVFDLEKDVRYTLTQNWDRSPDSLAFSKDTPDILYLTVGDHARSKVFALAVPPTPTHSSTHPSFTNIDTTPRALTADGAASGLQALPGGRVLFSRSWLTGPNDVWILRGLDSLEKALATGTLEDKSKDTTTREGAHVALDLARVGAEEVQVTRLTSDALSGKSLRAPEDFYFTGAEGRTIHGFVVKPAGWTAEDKIKGKAWPVLLLIHGGPEGVWDDRWSTRWNPNVFAQQGYFVVAINPTGSTTFGQELTDAIQLDWGGKPFIDLMAGWKHVLGSYPEIDAERAVAAGASWGGYAINWIQGHPEYGFGFKALFCHDGVFDAVANGFSTDELYFFNNEWGGRPWEPRAQTVLKKFNAREFVHRWSTPMLVVHGSKDYRLPETEGISAYHTLTQLGVPTRLVIFPDENHWVLNHGNSLKWHYEVFRWFDIYVGKKDE